MNNSGVAYKDAEPKPTKPASLSDEIERLNQVVGALADHFEKLAAQVENHAKEINRIADRVGF